MKRKRESRVYVCHECHIAGVAVDEDGCCVGCGCDLNSYEENSYFVGKGFSMLAPGEVPMPKSAADVVRAAVRWYRRALPFDADALREAVERMKGRKQ